jgi:hypothetical protein
MTDWNRIEAGRKLPEKSYLYYEFPKLEDNPPYIPYTQYEAYIPMLENIEISESHKPNLAVYDLVGRPGNLFAHLGSKSREFSLKFKITLPHVKDYINTFGLNSKFTTFNFPRSSELIGGIPKFYDTADKQIRVPGAAHDTGKYETKYYDFRNNLSLMTEIYRTPIAMAKYEQALKNMNMVYNSSEEQGGGVVNEIEKRFNAPFKNLGLIAKLGIPGEVTRSRGEDLPNGGFDPQVPYTPPRKGVIVMNHGGYYNEFTQQRIWQANYGDNDDYGRFGEDLYEEFRKQHTNTVHITPDNDLTVTENDFNALGVYTGKTDGSHLEWIQDANDPDTFRTEKAKPPPPPTGASNLVMLWINIIRSSTIANYSQNASLGPPVIYLNHGVMYRNIPCICTAATVKIVDILGYDLLNLMPRQVEITIQLSENKAGRGGSFTPFDQVLSDNAAGWQALIEYGTMDKQYGVGLQ